MVVWWYSTVEKGSKHSLCAPCLLGFRSAVCARVRGQRSLCAKDLRHTCIVRRSSCALYMCSRNIRVCCVRSHTQASAQQKETHLLHHAPTIPTTTKESQQSTVVAITTHLSNICAFHHIALTSNHRHEIDTVMGGRDSIDHGN
jgi:hypothetical protein